MADSLIRPIAVNVNTGVLTYAGSLTTSEITDGTLTTADVDTSSFDARYALVAAPFGFPYTIDPGDLRFLATSTDVLAVQGANAAHYLRVIGGGSVSKIGLLVNTQSGNICASVHSNSGTGRLAVPGTRVATTGSIACPAAGYRELDLGGSVTVSPGDWIGLGADNTTAKFGTMLGSAGDSNIGLGRQFRQASAFPAPSPPSSLTATLGYDFCLVGVA